jgi:hypothetical protein
MHINKSSVAIFEPFLVIILMAVIVIAGCKGKEEKQTVVGGFATGQQQTEGANAPGETQTGEPSGSAQNVIGNHPPKITSLKVSPEIPVIGDVITAEVKTFDLDGDPISVKYLWSKNDSPLSEISQSLKITDDFKRGDKITLKVTPNDNQIDGSAVSIVVEIANAPPVISPSQDTFRFDGNLYSYQIKASDADKDTLTYSLKSAPSGMKINPSTGLINWSVPPEFQGRASFTVSVTDGHGNEVLQSFTLDLIPEQRR